MRVSQIWKRGERFLTPKDLCDLIVARQISSGTKGVGSLFDDWEDQPDDPDRIFNVREAKSELKRLNHLHFPITFPEVFLRDQSGFDVILGNPPWDKVKTEEHLFWARHFPGLRGLLQNQQQHERVRMRLQRPDLMETYKAEHDEMKSLRSALTCGFYPGMGTGDPDLYKAFCWRFWNLCTAEHGHIGVVLPRIAFAGKGSKEFRKEVFSSSEQFDLTILVNNRQWVFPDIHPQYTIGLVCIQRGIPNERSIHLRGPFTSIALFSEHSRKQSAAFS